MTDVQENKLSMFEGAEIVLMDGEHRPIWSPVAKFAALVPQFQNLITDIHTLAMEQAEIITGYSAEKIETRAKLIGATMKVVHGVRTLAIFTDDTLLEESVNFTYSDLRNSRDNVLTDITGNVYGIAQPLTAGLAEYLVTEADIEIVNSLRTEFLGQIGQPRAAKVRSKNATEELARKFEETDVLLKEKMDRTIMIFKGANPRFVEKYFGAREVIDLGVRHTGQKEGKIWGTVRDSETQMPIDKALVRILATKRQIYTDAEGRYTFKFRKKGMPKIEASKDEYQNVTQGPVEIGPDMVVKLDFVMVRVGN